MRNGGENKGQDMYASNRKNDDVFPKLFSRTTFLSSSFCLFLLLFHFLNGVNIFNELIDLFFISFQLGSAICIYEIPLNLSIPFHTYSKQVINSVECYIIHNAAIDKERQNNLVTFTYQSNNWRRIVLSLLSRHFFACF